MSAAEKYRHIVQGAFQGYGDYLYREVMHPHWTNFFYWLLALSLLCWSLEILFPWRKDQPVVRRDFWLDAFYMLFNFFLFSLIGYHALSDVGVEVFRDILMAVGIRELVVLDVADWPTWVRLLTLFLVRDFIQWNVHRLLHRVDWLWQFHKVHHSVEEMGFAAHLRYHPVETVVYRTLEYVPLAVIGFGLTDFFIVHLFALAIGHLNHSNIHLPLGGLRYLLNTPQAHTWHHAKEPPRSAYGVNFGITLSVWDYLFGTGYFSTEGAQVVLGFEGMESFPRRFWQQLRYPFKRPRALPSSLNRPNHPSMQLPPKNHEEESVFKPINLMREARRQKGVPDGPVPTVCILDPDGDIADFVVKNHQARPCDTWACYHTSLLTFQYQGVTFGIIGRAVGASFAVLLAEQLFVSGCGLLVSITSAGIINPPVGNSRFILIEEALRDEGTSHHYLPAGEPARLSESIGKDLISYFKWAGLSVEVGRSWTTDAPYRETPSAIAAAKSQGVTCVEMESAALYAFARACGQKVVCYAHLTNTMAQEGNDFEKGEENGSLDSLKLLVATVNALQTNLVN